MQIFYGQAEGEYATLTPEESRHAVTVLRKHAGDVLDVMDGLGNRYRGPIIADSHKRCVIHIEEHQSDWGLMPYTMHLAVAPTKNMDRLEWLCEKAVEIGITRITPLLCEHSERRVLKPERLQRIVLAAGKQSLKGMLPELDPLTPFKAFIDRASETPRYMAHCAEGPRAELAATLHQNPSCTVLIGPEGDFSPREIELAMQAGITPVTLGPQRLRTETAGLVAVHTASLMYALAASRPV